SRGASTMVAGLNGPMPGNVAGRQATCETTAAALFMLGAAWTSAGPYSWAALAPAGAPMPASVHTAAASGLCVHAHRLVPVHKPVRSMLLTGSLPTYA